DTFQRQAPTRERFVDKDDPLLDCAEIRGEVLANVDAPALPSTVVGAARDSSVHELTIAHDVLEKRVYAVNGNTNVPSPVQVNPGDAVTFRIRYPIPSGDAEQLFVEDFLPFPIFTAQLFTFNACGPNVPPAQT